MLEERWRAISWENKFARSFEERKFNKKNWAHSTISIFHPFPFSGLISNSFFSHFTIKSFFLLLLLITFRQGNDMKIMEIHFSFFFTSFISYRMTRSSKKKCSLIQIRQFWKEFALILESCWPPRGEKKSKKIDDDEILWYEILRLWCRLTWDMNMRKKLNIAEDEKEQKQSQISNLTNKIKNDEDFFSIFKMSLTLSSTSDTRQSRKKTFFCH